MPDHELFADYSRALWPALAVHLAAGTLAALLASGAAALLGRAPARTRRLVWLAALATFLLPAALPAALARLCGLDLFAHWPGAISLLPGAAFVFPAAQPAPAGAWHGELLCALTLLWAAGAVALGARWLGRRRQFALALAVGHESAAGRAGAALSRARRCLLFRQRIGLVISPAVAEPGLWGVRRPVVVLPEGLEGRLSDDELDAVMLHELIHARRRDNLLDALQLLACCLFWFHPLVWLIDRRLLAERELACDEEVIRFGGQPRLYALSLWKVAQFGLGWPVAGLSRAAGANLRRRIEHMLHDDVQSRPTTWQRLLAGASVILLAAPSLAAGLFTTGGARARNMTAPGAVLIGGVPGGVARGQEVSKPQLRYRPKAEYTDEARRNRVEGEVELSVVFGKDGKIGEIRVLRSLPDGLTEAAVAAAQRIEFDPALKDGQPVNVRASIVFKFALE